MQVISALAAAQELLRNRQGSKGQFYVSVDFSFADYYTMDILLLENPPHLFHVEIENTS